MINILKNYRLLLPATALTVLGLYITQTYILKEQTFTVDNQAMDNSTVYLSQLVENGGPMSSEELAKEIEALNAANREHLQAFLDAGWQEVDAEAHDPAVVELNPDLLETRETELRQQLETTRVSADDLDKAAYIALNANESRTRAAAIESIGHRRYGEGGEVLIDLFETLTEESERGKALGFIRIESLESSTAEWAITQLSLAQVQKPLKEQLANKLLLTGLMEHRGDQAFIPGLLEKIPEELHESVHETVEMIEGKHEGTHIH